MGMFCGMLVVPHSVVMDMRNVIINNNPLYDIYKFQVMPPTVVSSTFVLIEN